VLLNRFTPCSPSAATAQLTALESRGGYSLCLLQIVSMPQVAGGNLKLQLSAAIAFKNFVLHSWEYEGSEHQESGGADLIPASDRATIKTYLVSLMVSQPKIIQKQLSQSLAIISSHDFPAKWTNLLPELVARFEEAPGQPAKEPNEILGVLEVMHSIFYRYRTEMVSQKLWTEISVVLGQVAEPLSKLFLQWTARLSDAAHASNPATLPIIVSIIALIVDNFHSLNSQDIAAQFEEKPILTMWFTNMLELMRYTSPVLEAHYTSASTDVDEPTKLDELKTSICDIINLFSYKYEDQFSEFVPHFVTCIWSLLTGVGASKRYDTLTNAAIKFLTVVVKKSQFKALFDNEQALQMICTKVIIPQLRLRESDLDTFEYNPQEYIRMDIEGSDVDTRRRTSVDFIHGLTMQFESSISTILKGYVAELLKEYETSRATKNGFLSKDTAMYIVLALSAKSKYTRAEYGEDT
jgi:exportin-2 (importin alpha re-exporter)